MSELGIRRISSIEEWDALVSEAGDGALWLLKHSLICPLSSEGLKEFERFAASSQDKIDDDSLFAIIEVQNARDVSTEIARRTGVKHETPQVILLVGNTVGWHASHWEVTVSALARAPRPSTTAAGAGSE